MLPIPIMVLGKVLGVLAIAPTEPTIPTALPNTDSNASSKPNN